MAEGAYGKWGIARTYALIFGIAYLAVATTEAIAQDALDPVLRFTGIQNAIHWAVGAVVLLSFFGSERTAKAVARVIGVVFAIRDVRRNGLPSFRWSLGPAPEGRPPVR